MAYPHIETKQDYKRYKDAVQSFLIRYNVEIEPYPIQDKDGHWHTYFSWYPCDCCNRQLGGDRTECRGLSHDNQYIDVNLCSDCIYYLCYGVLDDLTMMTIEESEG